MITFNQDSWILKNMPEFKGLSIQIKNPAFSNPLAIGVTASLHYSPTNKLIHVDAKDLNEITSDFIRPFYKKLQSMHKKKYKKHKKVSA